MLTGPMTARRSNSKTAYGLMSDIVAYILEEPKRVYMGDWLIEDMDTIEDVFETKGPACGTVGCIAGNAVLLTDSNKRMSVEGNALRILGGPDDYDLRHDLDNLFLCTVVDANYGTKKYARIVAKRIERFQREHEAALRAVKIAK